MDYLIYLDELNIIEIYEDDKELIKFLVLDEKLNTIYIASNTKLRRLYEQYINSVGYADMHFPKITCPKNILYT